MAGEPNRLKKLHYGANKGDSSKSRTRLRPKRASAGETALFKFYLQVGNYFFVKKEATP